MQVMLGCLVLGRVELLLELVKVFPRPILLKNERGRVDFAVTKRMVPQKYNNTNSQKFYEKFIS